MKGLTALTLTVSILTLSLPAFALTGMEREFLMKSAQGGIAEVSMGKMAEQKASNQDVQQFGARMVTDHTKVNDQLKQLAAQKKVTLPQQTDKAHQQMEKRLGGLQGTAFDKAYMTEMVADHQKDVNAFEKASKQAKDPDVKRFASDTLPVLREHLTLARNLKAKLK